VWILERDQSSKEEESESHRRKETTDKSNPTVYSYCRVSINATGCLAWERASLDVQFKGVQSGVDFKGS
jgi:hypothetical protein